MSEAQMSGAEKARIRREHHLAVAGRAKNLLSWLSIVGLGVFAYLAASHVTGVTSRQGTPTTTPTTSPTSGQGNLSNSQFFNSPSPSFGTSSGLPVGSTGGS